jgi:hypothetical protein
VIKTPDLHRLLGDGMLFEARVCRPVDLAELIAALTEDGRAALHWRMALDFMRQRYAGVIPPDQCLGCDAEPNEPAALVTLIPALHTAGDHGLVLSICADCEPRLCAGHAWRHVLRDELEKHGLALQVKADAGAWQWGHA